MSARSSSLLLVLLACSASPTAVAAPAAAPTTTPSSSSAVKPRPFGPFDSGAARAVTRQGDKGRARRAHPVVGAVDHIPGAGPPPPPLRSDPYLPERQTEQANVVGGGLSSNPLYLASLFYSNFLTRTDGPRCQHLPTCSRFASQAVARYGVLGIPIGLDRLIQPASSSSLRLLPEVDWGGVTRAFDPVENYEFWRVERFTGFPLLVPEEPLLLAPVTVTAPVTDVLPSSPASATTPTALSTVTSSTSSYAPAGAPTGSP